MFLLLLRVCPCTFQVAVCESSPSACQSLEMQPLVVLQHMAVHVDAVTCDFVVEVEQKQVHCWTWWLGQRLLLKACPWTFQVAVCQSGPVAYQSSEMRPLVVLQHVAVLVDAVTCDFVVEVEQKQVHCWTLWLEQLATKKLLRWSLLQTCGSSAHFQQSLQKY